MNASRRPARPTYGLALLLVWILASSPLVHADSGNLGCILKWLKESFPVAAMREASGLIRSPAKRLVFHASGERIFKELKPYFGKKVPVNFIPLTENTAPGKLLEMDVALRGGGFPTTKARQGVWFNQWNSAKEVIAKQTGGEVYDVSDFVIFHESGQVGFIKKDDLWLPVKLRTPSPKSSIGNVTPTPKKAFKINPGESELDFELRVRDFARKYHKGGKVRTMSAATNDMRYARDQIFEWDGELASTLRSKGGRDLPELQNLTWHALRKGIKLDLSGNVSAIPEVRDVLSRMYNLAHLESRKSFEIEFDYAMKRAVFHELLYRNLGRQEDLIRKFLNSQEYERYAKNFLDTHISYAGAPQFEIAQGMLAEMSLYRFEKRFQNVTSPANSYSQKHLAQVDGYHSAISRWLESHGNSLPQDIPNLVRIMGSTEPFSLNLKISEELWKAIATANESLGRLTGQVNRHAMHNKFTGMLSRAGFITDTRRSFPNNVIANVGIGKATVNNEEIYTLAAYMDPQRVGGYLGPSRTAYRELRAFTPLERKISKGELAAIVRKLVNAKNFDEQRDLIEKFAGELSYLLAKDAETPKMVQNFASTIFSDRLAEVIVPEAGRDPNVISRFFPDSYKQFQKMTQYRYLFDLTHGLTAELVKQKMGSRKYLERAISGKWKAYNFSAVSDEELLDTLKNVLQSGDARLRKLAHEHIQKTSLVEMREEVETWLGWDTYDMTFLKYAKNYDHWESLGAGWACICFIRKTVFNTGILRQF